MDESDSNVSEPKRFSRMGMRYLYWIVAYTVLFALFIWTLYFLSTLPLIGGWYSRAKGTLRSIGSSQLAYQQANKT
jgi:hypothetical protein